MKKTISLILGVLMAVSLLAGCASSGNGGSGDAGGAGLSGSVATDGSTSMEKVIGALGEAYEQKTGITVT